MAGKTYETIFELGGKLHPTFTKAFGEANRNAKELRNQIEKVRASSDFQKVSKGAGLFSGSLKKLLLQLLLLQ